MRKMLIAIAIVCLIPWNYAKADDAPLILDVKNLQPLAESALVMEHEKIEYVVSDDGEVSGTVEFTFANPTDEVIDQQTIFPIESNYGSGMQYDEGKAYAKEIRVKVNGKSIAPTTGSGQYLKRSEDGSLVVSQPASGVLFGFSVPAKGSTKVLVSFKPYMWSYGDAFLNFGYYYGSGVGWSGNIGKAEVSVKYPYEIQDGWIELYVGDVVKSDFVGKTANLEITDFEPRLGNEWLRFVILPPKMASKIIKAQGEAERLKNAYAYAGLAEVLKDTVDKGGSGFRPELRRPEFAQKGYWEAIGKMLEKKYGKAEPTFTDLEIANPSPRSPRAAAYELLEIYSGGWQPMYEHIRFDQLVDLNKYATLLDEVRIPNISENYWWMRDWSISDYEIETKIEYNDANWRANRIDLFPIVPSTAEAAGMDSTTTGMEVVTELPQPASAVTPPSLINYQAMTVEQNNEARTSPYFWFLLGLAGGLFSWSAWLWLTRREN